MNALAGQEDAKAESLVPPRPNLGPEPWPEPTAWTRSAGWLGLSVVLLLLAGLWIRKRRRSRRKPTSSLELIHTLSDFEPTPRQRLILASGQVREALILAFGPPWGSKTSEEIGAGPGLIEHLDPVEFDRLIAFLKLADRAKFADGEPKADEEWESWVTGIVARLALAPKSQNGLRGGGHKRSGKDK